MYVEGVWHTDTHLHPSYLALSEEIILKSGGIPDKNVYNLSYHQSWIKEKIIVTVFDVVITIAGHYNQHWYCLPWPILNETYMMSISA